MLSKKLSPKAEKLLNRQGPKITRTQLIQVYSYILSTLDDCDEFYEIKKKTLNKRRNQLVENYEEGFDFDEKDIN